MKTSTFKLLKTSNIILTILLSVVLFGAVNFLSSEFLVYRWDLTTTGEFSLSDKSLRILQELKKRNIRINVIGFFAPTQTPAESVKRKKVLDMLEEYHIRSDKMMGEVQTLDPDENPHAVQKFGVRRWGTLVFELTDPAGEGSSGQHFTLISPSDLWGGRMVDGKSGADEFLGENAFTSAVQSLLSGKRKTIYLVEGHGEASTKSKEVAGLKDFADLAVRNNFLLQPLNLSQNPEVPADASAIMIVGPQGAFEQGEVQNLIRYVDRGGKLMICEEVNRNSGLDKLYERVGVEIGNNLVVDPKRSFYMRPTSPIPLIGHHPIVNDLRAGKDNLLLATARSVERRLGDTRGIQTVDLLITSNDAWAESDFLTDPGKDKKIKFDPGTKDIKGPVTLALAIETDKAKAVIFGDSDFIGNDLIKVGANSDLVLNTLNWLVGDEQNLGISPKDPVFKFVTLTKSQTWNIFYFVVLGIPILIGGFGIWVWWRRRSL